MPRTMPEKATVYVKLSERAQVKVEMTHLELEEWGDVNEREPTMTEADAVSGMLAQKDWQAVPFF